MDKVRVGLIFGGRSVEHEVSVASATSIARALDPARYEVTLVAIDHDGRWHRGAPKLPPEACLRGDLVSLPAAPGEHTLVPASRGALAPASDLDVIFPIVHGRGGEDGALQGLL
jgi:D-alanine-D-alanine ligase